MKAISLWQPWASAVAVGSKRVETRTWETRYRGPLLIHAAKHLVKRDLLMFHSCWNWTGALWPLRWGLRTGLSAADRETPVEQRVPFGALIGVCDLLDVRFAHEFTQDELDSPRYPVGSDCPWIYEYTERQLGDFSLGRYGWVLGNARAFDKPIPYPGSQGLFNVPDELVREALERVA